jgi:hypothetical protein
MGQKQPQGGKSHDPHFYKNLLIAFRKPDILRSASPRFLPADLPALVCLDLNAFI